MGILDALTILASGAGRGYRASQQAKLEIANARRRALMEEQDQATRERLAASEMALGSARIGESEAAKQLSQFKLGEAQRQSTAGQQPFEGSFPRIPKGLIKSREDISTYSDIIREALQEQGAGERNIQDINARVTNPEVYGGRSRVPQTPEERRTDLLRSALSSPTIFEGTDPSKYQARLRSAIEVLREYDPEAFPNAPADTTSNRFRVKVKVK